MAIEKIFGSIVSSDPAIGGKLQAEPPAIFNIEFALRRTKQDQDVRARRPHHKNIRARIVVRASRPHVADSGPIGKPIR